MSESDDITEEEFDALLDKLAANNEDRGAPAGTTTTVGGSSEDITEEEFDALLDKLDQEKSATSADPISAGPTDSVVDAYLSDLCEEDGAAVARQTIVLQEHLSIANVAELRSELLAIDSAVAVEIDASSVASIDSAVVQLFYAFFKDAADNNREVVWADPTEDLLRIVDLLGMRPHLALGNISEEAA